MLLYPNNNDRTCLTSTSFKNPSNTLPFKSRKYIDHRWTHFKLYYWIRVVGNGSWKRGTWKVGSWKIRAEIGKWLFKLESSNKYIFLILNFPTQVTTFQVHFKSPTSARTFKQKRRFPTSEETFQLRLVSNLKWKFPNLSFFPTALSNYPYIFISS